MKSREMEAVFNKLKIKKLNCKHHIRGYFEYEGKQILPVYYSFGNKDLPGFVLQKISKSMGLSASELKRMARCKISKDEYVEILKKRGLIV